VIKNRIEDLSVFGGTPAFGETLHVGRPNIGNRERLFSRFNDLLDRNWLTNNGPFVREFEQQVANLLGVKHCVAMCNGTVALEIATRAMDLNGEVIIPSFTFVSTAHCLQWQEITPVFCDIDPEKHNIDPARIEQLITPRTTGIIGVHLWGRPCNVEAIEDIARKHNLRFLFDASHGFSNSYKGRMIGGFGDAETFSFHSTKFINAFEGGAVVTNNDELAKKMRLMKNFGFSGLDNVIYIGTNGKMSEVSAAMGLTSLESIEELVGINKRNYHEYRKNMSDLAGLKLVRYEESEKNNYQYIVLEVDEGESGISRDRLISILHAERIRARRYFYPGCHRMEPYRSYFPHAGLLLPVTEKLTERVLCLPTGKNIRKDDVVTVCDILRFATRNSSEIMSRLHSDNGKQ